MTITEREEIRDSTTREIATLEESIATLADLADSEFQSDANDWFSSKESNISKDINEQALAKATQRLILLNDILKRIDSPDFGICTLCNQPIPIARLQAIPTSRHCIPCINAK